MIFEHDKVVVGGSLTALMYAFINNFPILFADPDPPNRFDYLSPDTDLSFLKLENHRREIKTFNESREIGLPKILLWERLSFLMSLKGLMPLSNICHSMRLQDNIIKCSNEYSKIAEFRFNQCLYFGDKATSGFIEKTNLDEETYICYDHIAFNSGGKHEIDYITTNDDFVSQIWFYSSDRIDGNTPVRDACAVSRITREQLLDFDFSQTMAKFKTIQTMKDNGMRGKFNGFTKKGTPRHYDFRTTSIRRETSSTTTHRKTKSDCVEIKKENESGLLSHLKDNIDTYDRILEGLDAA